MPAARYALYGQRYAIAKVSRDVIPISIHPPKRVAFLRFFRWRDARDTFCQQVGYQQRFGSANR